MNTEGDVLQHVQAVCDGDAGQDHVDGVVPHVGVGQHQDVQEVEETSQQADIQRKVAVYRIIHLLHKNMTFSKIHA